METNHLNKPAYSFKQEVKKTTTTKKPPSKSYNEGKGRKEINRFSFLKNDVFEPI